MTTGTNTEKVEDISSEKDVLTKKDSSIEKDSSIKKDSSTKKDISTGVSKTTEDYLDNLAEKVISKYKTTILEMSEHEMSKSSLKQYQLLEQSTQTEASQNEGSVIEFSVAFPATTFDSEAAIMPKEMMHIVATVDQEEKLVIDELHDAAIPTEAKFRSEIGEIMNKKQIKNNPRGLAVEVEDNSDKHIDNITVELSTSDAFTTTTAQFETEEDNNTIKDLPITTSTKTGMDEKTTKENVLINSDAINDSTVAFKATASVGTEMDPIILEINEETRVDEKTTKVDAATNTLEEIPYLAEKNVAASRTQGSPTFVTDSGNKS